MMFAMSCVDCKIADCSLYTGSCSGWGYRGEPGFDGLLIMVLHTRRENRGLHEFALKDTWGVASEMDLVSCW